MGRFKSESTIGKLGFIGAGLVGTGLSRAFYQAGYQIVAVSSRTRFSAGYLAESVPGCQIYDDPQRVADAADLVFLTVPDESIQEVARSVHWRVGHRVVHCSGASPLSVLDCARYEGALVGGFHPLQIFADPELVVRNLPGSAFALEADPILSAELEKLVKDLDGWAFFLDPKDRVLYHASAVAVCGLLVTLIKLSADLWEDFVGLQGDNKTQALTALIPLVRTTVETVSRKGPIDALTGPLTRGDLAVVREHISRLSSNAPGFLPLYCHLGLATLAALSQGSKSNSVDRKHLEVLLRDVIGPDC